MFISFDISTKLLAYAVFNDEGLYEYGRLVPFHSATNIIGSITERVHLKFKDYEIDHVVYENGFLANSPKTLMDLSKVTGAMLGGMWMCGAQYAIPVPPITWQTGIGIGRTSNEDYKRLQDKWAGKSQSWIKSRDRENRKQLIIDFVNKEYDLKLDMGFNDEADSIALGHFARKKYNL